MFLSGKKLGILLSAIGTSLAAAIDECGFVNTLLGEDASYNCCNYGYPNIKCSADHITYIDLSGKGISAEFPSSIGNLPQLSVLNLSKNKITGSLPDLSGLTGLVELNISGNEISGSLPESVEKLTSLKVLNADNNKIDSIQEKLTSLPLLTDLILSNNEISGSIPDFVAKFASLKNLNLSGNKLTGSIPDAIGSDTNLITLNLSNNQLDGGIPKAIGNLSNLRVLNLSKNKLAGEIPSAELEKLKNVAELNLEGNIILYGKIPEIAYDDANYVCKFKDTNLCYASKLYSRCEYTDYDCTKCVENASVVNGVCTCKDNYSGAGYILCSDGSDLNLNTGEDSAANFRATFQSLTIATLILLASYLLM